MKIEVDIPDGQTQGTAKIVSGTGTPPDPGHPTPPNPNPTPPNPNPTPPAGGQYQPPPNPNNNGTFYAGGGNKTVQIGPGQAQCIQAGSDGIASAAITWPDGPGTVRASVTDTIGGPADANHYQEGSDSTPGLHMKAGQWFNVWLRDGSNYAGNLRLLLQ